MAEVTLGTPELGKTTEGSTKVRTGLGKPTVRDRREAYGNAVIIGADLRPIGKPLE